MFERNTQYVWGDYNNVHHHHFNSKTIRGNLKSIHKMNKQQIPTNYYKKKKKINLYEHNNNNKKKKFNFKGKRKLLYMFNTKLN